LPHFDQRYTDDMRFCAAIVLLLVPSASGALAADDRTAAVGGNVSAMDIDSYTALSVSGSFEYRFTRVVGLEIEATLAPTLKSPFPNSEYTILGGSSPAVTAAVAPQLSALGRLTIYPGPTYTNADGRAVIFSNNVRIAIPTTTERLEPYFVAGGGMASVRHTADLVYGPFPLATPNPPTGIVVPTLPVRQFTQHVTSSSNDLAVTLGGGLSVRATSQFWIDADLRLFRLLGNTDRNVGRFGVGFRYRF
jgi:opacity protein-like surface antigen